jgi:hypothetical protein
MSADKKGGERRMIDLIDKEILRIQKTLRKMDRWSIPKKERLTLDTRKEKVYNLYLEMSILRKLKNKLSQAVKE